MRVVFVVEHHGHGFFTSDQNVRSKGVIFFNSKFLTKNISGIQLCLRNLMVLLVLLTMSTNAKKWYCIM